ncbi:MAG: protein kinase, partial [Clostridia bacterium]|nr:protein kinase [Clostridia bacterium]
MEKTDLIPVGTILNDRYEVKSFLGIGGMSVVYEARDIVLDIDVALKVLKSEYSDSPDHIERIKREAENVSGLRHPNIVKVYGLGHYCGKHYIAMERINGVNVDELIRQGGALEWQDCVEIMKQVLAALCYVHSKGVVHKDIKPQNILIDENKHVTLTDFGIAKTNRPDSFTRMAGDRDGSVYYMAPEQEEDGTTNRKTDIYSLGITFYEMLVGNVPFDGESAGSVAIKRSKYNVIPACVVDETIPRAVSDVVVLATMKDPADRFSSAEEMLDMLIAAEKEPEAILVSAQYMLDKDIITEDCDLARKEGAHKVERPEGEAPSGVEEVSNYDYDQQRGPEGDKRALDEIHAKEDNFTAAPARIKRHPGRIVITALAVFMSLILGGAIIWFYVDYYLDNRTEKVTEEQKEVLILTDYTGYNRVDVQKMLAEKNIEV